MQGTAAYAFVPDSERGTRRTETGGELLGGLAFVDPLVQRYRAISDSSIVVRGNPGIGKGL